MLAARSPRVKGPTKQVLIFRTAAWLHGRLGFPVEFGSLVSSLVFDLWFLVVGLWSLVLLFGLWRLVWFGL